MFECELKFKDGKTETRLIKINEYAKELKAFAIAGNLETIKIIKTI